MLLRLITALLSLFIVVGSSLAQPLIYKSGTNLITGTWDENGTLAEVGGNSPYEGGQHYQFAYSYTGYWAGVGLNMDNWGGAGGIDFSAYSHIRVAYRGLSSGQELSITLRTGNAISGNTLSLGGSVGNYTVVEIPLFSLEAGTSLNLSNITEIMLSVSSAAATGSGTVYVDAIELYSETLGNNTSAQTWSRFSQMNKGINLSNWLEAYWLIPFNAYPETNRYTRQKMADFHSLGFDAIRMPVTFENLAATSPPYTLNTAHPAFSLVDSMILWAEQFNMRLIIDMHHGYGLTDANYASELPRLEAIWEQLISRYGSLDPERYFFEIYNEPNGISNANWRTVAHALVDVIRNAGSTHTIIIGGNGWNSIGGLLGFLPLADPDIIYTFHFYDPYFFTHQGMSWTSPPYLAARSFPIGSDIADVTGQIAAARDWADVYNAPVLAGEFGVATAADATSRCNWVATVAGAFEDNGFPWMYWDAITPSDAFGFFNGGIINQANMVDCFEAALGIPSSPTPLAIRELYPLQPNCQTDGTHLRWHLYSDEPAYAFVEAFDTRDKRWVTLAELPVNNAQQLYSFTASAYPLYRLRVEELDGSVHYSALQHNPCLASGEWKLYPNPIATGQTATISHEDVSGTLFIQVFDPLARQVLPVQRIGNYLAGQPVNLLLPAHLAAGTYQLVVVGEDGAVWRLPLVIMDGK